MSLSTFRHKISFELSEDVGFMMRWEAFYNSLDFKDSSIPVKGRSYRQECATAYDLISWILELWTARKTEKVATVENLVGKVAELGFPVLARNILNIKKVSLFMDENGTLVKDVLAKSEIFQNSWAHLAKMVGFTEPEVQGLKEDGQSGIMNAEGLAEKIISKWVEMEENPSPTFQMFMGVVHGFPINQPMDQADAQMLQE